jgi:hypothetical protein
VLLGVTISTFLGVGFLFYGASGALDKILRREEFEIEAKKSSYIYEYIPELLMFMLTLTLVLSTYRTNEI